MVPISCALIDLNGKMVLQERIMHFSKPICVIKYHTIFDIGYSHGYEGSLPQIGDRILVSSCHGDMVVYTAEDVKSGKLTGTVIIDEKTSLIKTEEEAVPMPKTKCQTRWFDGRFRLIERD